MTAAPKHTHFVWVGCPEDRKDGPHFPCASCQWVSNVTTEKAAVPHATKAAARKKHK